MHILCSVLFINNYMLKYWKDRKLTGVIKKRKEQETFGIDMMAQLRPNY